jgi:glutaryl-CoA dehydrogenase
MLSGKGISDEFGVVPYLVKLEIVNTYEGTHEEHSLILRRDIAGISAICSSTPVADAGLAFG